MTEYKQYTQSNLLHCVDELLIVLERTVCIKALADATLADLHRVVHASVIFRLKDVRYYSETWLCINLARYSIYNSIIKY